MKRMVPAIYLSLFLAVMVTTPCFGQGISSILERLDTLEQQVAAMESSLQDVPIGGSATDLPNFSAYDQSLAQIDVQLAALKEDVSSIPRDPASPDPALENRIARLETKNQELVPLLNQMKADQKAGFAEIQASLAATQAPGAAPTVTTTTVAVSDSPAESNDPGELVLSGFVDASYFYDGSTAQGSFGLDQVEIDGDMAWGDAGSLRFDVEWVSDGEGGFTTDVEQGFVTYSPEFAGQGYFTFGKFNAPIGFELLDAPDMFQYSHALVFNYGLPTNLTGLMYNTSVQDFDIALHLSNGWDVNVDPDNEKTIGGRLGWGGLGWGAIGFSAIHGTEFVDETTSTKLTVYDIDLAADPADNWTMGGELNFGSNDLGEETQSWWGFLVMSHWDFNPTVGATIRYDYFDDQDNSRLGSAVAEVRQAITLAPTFALGDGMGALFELRWDFSDEEVFTNSDGEPEKSALTFAYEMTYCF